MIQVQRFAISWMLMAAWCITAPVPAAEPPVVDAPSPFAAARSVPADVSLYVHVDDAADIRREIADRPIGRWLEGVVRKSTLGSAWTALAETSDRTQDDLFDQLLGTRFTLVTRTTGKKAEWAIITSVPPTTMRELRTTWRVQRQLPAHGLAISILPEQDIILAEDGHTVVFGSRAQPDLFTTIIASLGAPLDDSLADVDDVREKVQAIEAQRCGVYLRHDEFVGGSSLITFDVNGDALRLRHAATFENPPFQRPVTTMRCNFSMLRSFERDQLFAVMEPTDIGTSRVETFAMQYIGEALTGADFHNAIGTRRIYAIGEEEGRLRDVPDDILAPIPAVCVEVKADAYSVEQLDQQMSRVAARLNDLNDGALLVEVPPCRAYVRGHQRSIDISDAVSAFSGGFPIMKTLTLNWDVTEGADGTWCVVAGSADQLDAVVRSLKADVPTAGKMVGTYDSVGTINGLRLGRQLHNWAQQADVLAPPGQQQEFRQAINFFAGMVDSTDRIRWQMARPDAKKMRLDIDVTLRDDPSAAARD